MSRRIFTAFLAALLALSLAGCGSEKAPDAPQPPSDSPETFQAVYSNLADEGSQTEVIAALEARGVSTEQTDTLLEWTKDFNSRVTQPPLPEGFVPMEGNYVDYSQLLFDYKELPDGELFPEVNCRLTAFLLMRGHIQTNGSQTQPDTYLMFDVDAVDTYPEYQLSPEERSNFITLFNGVPLEGAATQEEHLAKIQQAWQDRGIQVDTSTGLSLIQVYLHSTFDDLRFVGHTGVLLEEPNGLLFVEKFGPAAPFQATRFQDRAQLADYLLARPDLYGEETELPPLLLENGAVMDTAA